MTNIGIALMVMIMAFDCFSITFRLNGINRTLMEIPLSIFELAVPLVREEDEIEMKFDKEYLIDELDNYFNHKLPFYTANYQVNYYFTKTGSESLCLDDSCTAIEITLDADIVFFTKYHKTTRYEIEEGRHGH